jgi:hypothetical protein
MRLLLRAGLVLGLAAAACKDSVGPKSLADPQATTAQMEALDGLFDNAPLNSFSAVSGDIAPVAPARVAALRALVSASNPLSQSSALRPFAKGVETSRLLRQLAPALISTSAAALFPPDVVGKTFEWNATTDMYEATARAGAPSNGVRFILYAIDPFTHAPVEPVSEVGYVDLADESSGSTARVHVTVVGGSTVYVDYTVAVESLSMTSGRISAAGYITNGAGSPDTLRFNGKVTVSASQTSATITQDVSFDVNSRDAHIRLIEQVTFTQTTLTLRIYFSFKHGAETVTLEGKLTIDQVTGSATGTFTSKVNGGRFATCNVTADANSYNLSCQGADADGLNADEQAALQRLGDAAGHMSEVLGGILGPPLNILGAGF